MCWLCGWEGGGGARPALGWVLPGMQGVNCQHTVAKTLRDPRKEPEREGQASILILMTVALHTAHYTGGERTGKAAADVRTMQIAGVNQPTGQGRLQGSAKYRGEGQRDEKFSQRCKTSLRAMKRPLRT